MPVAGAGYCETSFPSNKAMPPVGLVSGWDYTKLKGELLRR